MTARGIACIFHHHEMVNGAPLKARATREVWGYALGHVLIRDLKTPFSKQQFHTSKHGKVVELAVEKTHVTSRTISI